ncbi:flagellar basal body-associated FliL family protein [Breoghania sp.]|uniref:flagellar basal body-associated FliL family protein n=1 Tax=Breoghania sp. TaxID=2065378 RepID=UPI002AA62DFF|nr:flagellar basal body-associated FliL family protein [Breoghania sp.]
MSDTSLVPLSSAVRERPRRSPAIVSFILLTMLAAGLGTVFGAQMVNTVRQSVTRDASDNAAVTSQFRSVYVSSDRLRTLMPMVTNLAAPRSTWIRLQASVILAEDVADEARILVSRIEQDTLAYLRTLKLSQIEGAAGLQHLREDLNERAKIRSDGKVLEVVLESLVIQ